MPVLVTGGQLDANTPPVRAKPVADRFPRGVFVEHGYVSHASWAQPDPTGSWCQRDFLREFLTHPHRPVGQGCQSPAYQVLGRYPLHATDIPAAATAELSPRQRTILAAAFATARDAAMHRQPGNFTPARLPGLRGGELIFPSDSNDIALEEVRHVRDLAVSGKITFAGPQRALAELRLANSALSFSWASLDPGREITVTGVFDGTAFTAGLSAF
ncbi:alpha/beta hydrolase [Crossiella sp. SN42]|nr:alpha/beta hydrolase [Crossiella sp. SN42]